MKKTIENKGEVIIYTTGKRREAIDVRLENETCLADNRPNGTII